MKLWYRLSGGAAMGIHCKDTHLGNPKRAHPVSETWNNSLRKRSSPCFVPESILDVARSTRGTQLQSVDVAIRLQLIQKSNQSGLSGESKPRIYPGRPSAMNSKGHESLQEHNVH